MVLHGFQRIIKSEYYLNLCYNSDQNDQFSFLLHIKAAFPTLNQNL